MRFFRKAALNIGVVAELLTFFGSNKRWWLLPMSVVLAAAAVLLLIVQAVEYVAPFVYTVF